MTRWLYITLLAALAVANGHVLVEVEGGPEVEGRHLYVSVGGRWEPVHVAYQPEFIHTYIYATGETAALPYYNLSRYVLIIPRGALAASQRASPPQGFETWMLEVENGTRKVAIPLAVGPQPLRQDNETLTTWTTFSKQKIEAKNRGRFIDRPRDRGRQGGDVEPAGAAVREGASTFAAGSLYFKPVTVSGWFSTVVEVDSPTGYTTLCGYPQMHWVGYELWNMSLGVKVDGNLLNGTLVLELYRLGKCFNDVYNDVYKIDELYLSLPSKGSYWTNIQFSKYSPLDPTLFNVPLGVRIRVSGYAAVQTTISVMPVARYFKTVNSLAQIATSKAYTTNEKPFTVRLPAGTKSAILFGPYTAYDGGITPTSSTLGSIGWIDVPAMTVTLNKLPSCPQLTVDYYVNNVAHKTLSVGPRYSTPTGGRCYYDVPPQTLDLRQREYVISKAQSPGGGITVAIVFWIGGVDASATLNSRLTITYDRWIEPLHSQYYSPNNRMYGEWREILLYNTREFLGPEDSKTLHVVTEIRAMRDWIALYLSTNNGQMCQAQWVISKPVRGSSLYYDGKAVEETWWQTTASIILDEIKWIGEIKGWLAIILEPVRDLIESATGSVTVRKTSDGKSLIIWKRGWLVQKDVKNVTIPLLREASPPTQPRHLEWSYFAVSFQRVITCDYFAIFDATYMSLPSDLGEPSPYYVYAKIWTWRGQTPPITGHTIPR
ncbi:MAG: hypothetical protein QXP31_02045 [Pyrobaculum sp.]